jgi:hypothetical protein
VFSYFWKHSFNKNIQKKLLKFDRLLFYLDEIFDKTLPSTSNNETSEPITDVENQSIENDSAAGQSSLIGIVVAVVCLVVVAGVVAVFAVAHRRKKAYQVIFDVSNSVFRLFKAIIKPR